MEKQYDKKVGKSKFHREDEVPQWRAFAKEKCRSGLGWNEDDARWYQWLWGKKNINYNVTKNEFSDQSYHWKHSAI